MVFVAGQVAIDRSGAVVAPGDIEAQAARTYENIGVALAAVGARWGHVVRTTTYLTDRSCVAGLNRVRRRMFPVLFGDGVYPVNALLLVSGLLLPELLVEVEATAIIADAAAGGGST
jgi:enamine deaminase RidA (YjgF/YER057c/UK114 family)